MMNDGKTTTTADFPTVAKGVNKFWGPAASLCVALSIFLVTLQGLGHRDVYSESMLARTESMLKEIMSIWTTTAANYAVAKYKNYDVPPLPVDLLDYKIRIANKALHDTVARLQHVILSSALVPPVKHSMFHGICKSFTKFKRDTTTTMDEVYTHTHGCTDARMHGCTDAHTHTHGCTDAWMHTHTHGCTHTDARMHTHGCTDAHIGNTSITGVGFDHA